MIHSELVASMSKPLSAMVNGKMKESIECQAEWPEVDEAMFIRFCEFAYTGGYKAAKPEPRKTAPPKPEPEPELENGLRNADAPGEAREYGVLYTGTVVPIVNEAEVPAITLSGGKSVRKKVRGRETASKDDRLWSQFANLVYDSLLPAQVEEAAADTDNLDFSEVFLSHARIYVLADYYDIERLMTLSLKELHKCLQRFQLSSENAEDVVGLAEYCYQNTVDRGSSPDRLRELVSMYIACKVEKIWGSRRFREILEKFGEIGKDVIGHMLERLD
jgi:hypothetical protein